jgi:hypothetical protein
MKLKSPIKAAEGRRSPKRCRADRKGDGVSGSWLCRRMPQSVVECASPSAYAARHSAASARRRLALPARTMKSCTCLHGLSGFGFSISGNPHNLRSK